MTRILITTIITYTVFSLTSLLAQEHDHDHEHHEHEHSHKNELSFVLGAVPIPSEGEIALGAHVHFVHGVAFDNKLGLGVSLGTIQDEHKHYTFSVVAHYRAYKGLVLSYAPGALYKIEEAEAEWGITHHFEAAYEIEIGNYHVGPVIEMGFEKEGLHYLGGVHFGLHF